MDSGVAFLAVIAGGLVTTFYTVSLLEMRKKGRAKRERESLEAQNRAFIAQPNFDSLDTLERRTDASVPSPRREG